MGVIFSKRRVFLSILVLAGSTAFLAPGRTQDRPRTGGTGERGPAVLQAGARGADAEIRRLGAQLRHFRSTGDLENAARIFGQLFAIESAADPAAELKTAASARSNRVDGAIGNVKPVSPAEGSNPVFVSPEAEKNPSADVWTSRDGAWALVTAAEQWSGSGPRDIRIRKSSDRGETWAETLVLGDGRAWTRPSLRQVADGQIGLAFVKDWDGGDGDIHFALISADLAAEAESPVALSQADQRNPSLATDFRAFSAPYVYVVYAESDGLSASVKFRVSPDLGASWSRAATIAAFVGPEADGIETALAFDPERGALHAAFTRPQGRASGIAVATSLNFGATWSEPRFVTPADDGSDSSPAIAASLGIVAVAYEHAGPGLAPDIGLARSPDSGRSWVLRGSLASSAAAESSPDIRAAEGGLAPVFFASYVEESARVRLLSSEGAASGSWTAAGTFPPQGGPAALGRAVVLPMPGPEGGESAGIIWADTTADDDVYFSPAVVTLSLAEMTVDPANRDVPYTEGTTTFAVVKTGDGQVNWTATVTTGGSWLHIQSGSSGTNSGTITVAYEENLSLLGRTGTIRVRATNDDDDDDDEAIPDVNVTVSQAAAPAGSLSVTPAEGLTSTGPEGGPFTPSNQAYTLTNVGATTINWRAVRVEIWTSLSATTGTLIPGATRTITVSINSGANGLDPGTYNDTVSFMNTTNGNGNTTREVSLTVTGSAGSLSVSPTSGFSSSGPVGGPFAPVSQDYILRNTGRDPIDWTAANSRPWTTLSATSGRLDAGATTTVTVSINSEAETLAVGDYGDTIMFTNTTNGNGNTSRAVSLTVTPPPGALTVTPSTGLSSSGPLGGPFTPSSLTYTLENTGGISLNWTASKTQTWTTLSDTGGALSPGATATVTVSINAAADGLPAGDHGDTVTFTNTSGGSGSTTRPVTLAVSPGPALIVVPANRDVPFTGGTTSFEVSNTGGGTMPWTAEVIAGGTWLTIQSGASGTDAGTVVAAFTPNPTGSPRAGIIRITAAGASGSPRNVTVTQAGSTFGLSLSGERLVERAWIIQREYGHLSIAVSNPGSITVDVYVIYRRAGAQAEEIVQQVSGSTVTTSPWTTNDAFLTPGTSYTYRVLAIDTNGAVLSASNEITI